MKKLLLPLIIALSSIVPLFCESTAFPGGVLVLSVEETSMFWNGTAVLEDTGRNVLSTAGMFTRAEESSGKYFFTFIVGVPSTAPPGRYILRYLLTGLDEVEETVDITILPKEFLSEDIPLNRELTAIRAEPDPRKDAEAAEFFKILRGFSKSALFSLQRHRLPVDDFITSSYFGDRRRYLYSNGGIGYSIHTGVDMAAPKGTSVYASGSGKVVFAADRIITGKTIIIEHLPGVYGIYYHLDSIAAVRGDYVKKGQCIGTVGSTGLSTGDHLHWEIRVGEVAVDPYIFVEGRVLDKAVVLGNHTSSN
jgi:hypothetical protein